MLKCFIEKVAAAITLIAVSLSGFAQADLNYYLPESGEYIPSVPTPATVIGHEVGEWHVTHDKLVYYFYRLAQSSPRVKVEKIGQTYEHRPLLQAIITSEKNHAILEQIRAEHLKLSLPDQSSSCNVKDMPVVIRLGYSVHGNEPSGANASLVVAYQLAASVSHETDEILDKCIIIIDPSLNPDGLQRFAGWVNAYKSANLNSDPNSVEFHEPWPRGRTNHYWFDLNRDWLMAQHPETESRLAAYHAWMPNIQTDHHEMRSDDTFFFQPGIPSGRNPLIPDGNASLTEKIARYHAAMLDKERRMYFSKEQFDDYYFGKGSTYPDIQGGVGILFEQGSSRGHLQETVNGPLSFPFTIKNQVICSFSTIRAAFDMREELLDYQRWFFANAFTKTGKEQHNALLLGTDEDETRVILLGQLLLKHHIIFHSVTSSIQAEGNEFPAGKSYILPLNQPQSRLISALFDRPASFRDSLFYDISAWNPDLSFNLKIARGTMTDWQKARGPVLDTLALPAGTITGDQGYAYMMEWGQYFAPAMAYSLLKKDVIVKLTNKSSIVEEVNLDRGAIMIPVAGQKMTETELHELVEKYALQYHVKVHTVSTGLATQGPDLGSGTFMPLKKPVIAMIVGESVSASEAGEVWHLLDYRYDIPVTMIDAGRLDQLRLDRYTVVVLPSGSYGSINPASQEKLKRWVSNGGTLVAFREALKFVASLQIADFKLKTAEKADSVTYIQYSEQEREKGKQEISGAIFNLQLDLTHPLANGYRHESLPVFKSGTLVLEPAKKISATPFLYSKSPLLSGYASRENLGRIGGSPAVVVSVYGQGRVIGFADDPNFRAFWYGTNRLFMNAVFWGYSIEVN